MERNESNQTLFNRVAASVLANQQRFAQRDAAATEAAARILEASCELARRDPDGYFGLAPSARDRFIVDTIERGTVVLAKLEGLGVTEASPVDREIDITGEAPRRPRTRNQRRRARGTTGGAIVEGFKRGVGFATDLIDLGRRIAEGAGELIDRLRPQPPDDSREPSGSGPSGGGGTVPRETPGPGGSSRDFFIEEKRYVLEQLEKALEGLERMGTSQAPAGGNTQ